MSSQDTNSKVNPPEVSHHEAVKTAHAVRKWVIVLAGTVVVSWVIIGVVFFKHRDSITANGDTGAAAATRPGPGQGRWGKLEYTPIVISAPSEYVSDAAINYTGPVVWRIPGAGSRELARFIDSCALDPAIAAELEKMAQIDLSIQGMSMHPSREFVLGLKPADRAKLYMALSGYQENTDIRRQFVFCGKSPDDWFSGSEVSLETRKLVEPLIYRHGNFMYFADIRTIYSEISSRSQQVALLKALRSESTFLAMLEVSSKSNIEELVNYWGRGGRVQDVRPILESLIRRPGTNKINITHLLPSLARRRLYTYPARSTADLLVMRDCHWTSLNFFNETPDDKFIDIDTCIAELQESYYLIHGHLQLGDIAIVLDKQGMAIHSATHIADGVFFHRCGSNSSAPWSLIRAENLMGVYLRGRGVRLMYYRRKNM